MRCHALSSCATVLYQPGFFSEISACHNLSAPPASYLKFPQPPITVILLASSIQGDFHRPLPCKLQNGGGVVQASSTYRIIHRSQPSLLNNPLVISYQQAIHHSRHMRIRARPTLFSRAQIHVFNGHNTSLLSKVHLLDAAGRTQSISSRRLVVRPAPAMDPAASSEEIIIDTPFFRIYGDRRIDRLVGTTIVPPGFDAATGVTSRDVTIDAGTGLYVRLYLPDMSDSDDEKKKKKKLPLLLYFHGGAFVTQSAAAPAYQPFLSTLAARAGLLVVSVNYRLAPEHPFPAGYEDSLRALEWAVAGGGGDPWLSRHGDLGRVFLAGESAGGNIAHNVAMMAADGAAAAAAVEGAALLHAGFSGREPVEGELPMWVETMGNLWAVVCPEAAEGTDDPRMNPAAAPASLRRMPCRRVLVCAAEKDFGTPRCRAYYEALAASGWGGDVEWFESKGEDHVFFLAKPADDGAVTEFMDRLVAFFTATGGN